MKTRPQHHRRGAAMMECAVTLPVLMILVLGILEIGTALRASTILQSACRESGSLVSIDWRKVVADGQTPNEKLEQDLRNYVTASGLSGAALVVELLHADGSQVGQNFDISNPANDRKMLKIQVHLPYSSVSLFPVRYLSGKTLTAFVVMRAAMNGGTLSQ
jgi:Flp pilus assembly protein TadG